MAAEPLATNTRAQRAAWLERLRRRYSQIFGAVYLLHFEAEIGNSDNTKAKAQHYTGFVEGITRDEIMAALANRWSEHGTEDGAKIMQAVAERGIKWHVAKIIIHTTKARELDLKEKTKNARGWCPICRQEIELGDDPVVEDDRQYLPSFEDLASRPPSKMDSYEYLRTRSFAAARTPEPQQRADWDDGLL